MIARLLLALLRGYKRFISPLLPQACRYTPTCSEYMAEAIRIHGPVKGVWLGGGRLCRCHPWGGHGYDPVPGNARMPECPNARMPEPHPPRSSEE